MIRKSMPSGLTRGWVPVFPRDKREAFARRSCSNKKIERDDDSKKSHPALADAGPDPFSITEAARFHLPDRDASASSQDRAGLSRRSAAGRARSPWPMRP